MMPATGADSHPHVVLITCHDLGRHLGCYGVHTVQSPHLDTLAAEGVRCDQAFTTSPSCSPSRAALATGRYPHSNGVMGLTHPPYDWDLEPKERHLAGILAEEGYDTHLFGFQHVTRSPERLGFRHLHGFDRLAGCHQRPAWGAPVAEQVGCLLHELPDAGPVYLEINLEEPHRPYDQGGAVPDDARGISVPPYLPDSAASRAELASLQGAIRQADAAVGVILRAIAETGRSDNTLLIFMADHGLAMPRAKCTLYDPGIEVALVLRWPAGGLMGGTVVRQMISNVDIMPTVLEAAGIGTPSSAQGRSCLALLRGDAGNPRQSIHAEKTYHSYRDPMRSVRTERFKYIRNFETTFMVEVPGDVQLGAIYREHVQLYSGGEHPPVELYDLDADPLEMHNLAADEGFREVERRLDEELWRWMSDTADPLLAGPVASPAYRRALAEAGRIND